MAKRTLAQINKEMNYATNCWQLCTLKTIPYRVRMKMLQKEKDAVLAMSEKDLAKLERQKVNRTESDLKSQLTSPNTGKDVAQPTIIEDRSEAEENIRL